MGNRVVLLSNHSKPPAVARFRLSEKTSASPTVEAFGMVGRKASRYLWFTVKLTREGFGGEVGVRWGFCCCLRVLCMFQFLIRDLKWP